MNTEQQHIQGVQEYCDKLVSGLCRNHIDPYILTVESHTYAGFESTVQYWHERAGRHFTTVKIWGFWSRILRERACDIADSELSLITKRVFWSRKTDKFI